MNDSMFKTLTGQPAPEPPADDPQDATRDLHDALQREFKKRLEPFIGQPLTPATIQAIEAKLHDVRAAEPSPAELAEKLLERLTDPSAEDAAAIKEMFATMANADAHAALAAKARTLATLAAMPPCVGRLPTEGRSAADDADRARTLGRQVLELEAAAAALRPLGSTGVVPGPLDADAQAVLAIAEVDRQFWQDRYAELFAAVDAKQKAAEAATYGENMTIRLTYRIKQLEDAIRKVVTQQVDDLCWMDVYTMLAELVGVKFDPAMLPPARMKRNCDRFVDDLLAGRPYATDKLTQIVTAHDQAVALLREYGCEGNELVAMVRAVLTDNGYRPSSG